MKIKFQYNKKALQQLKKQLQLRQKALPILKKKESALRKKIKEKKEGIVQMAEKLEKLLLKKEQFGHIWHDLPPLLNIKEVKLNDVNVVGVKTRELEEIVFEEEPFSLSLSPVWWPMAFDFLRSYTKNAIALNILEKQLATLELARRKTTQKVNLYEKVQIPALEAAQVKVKRFLEDRENIAKAAQKIIKTKHAAAQR